MKLDKQVLLIGYNMFDENLIESKDEFYSFFNVVPYKKLIREETSQKTRVTKNMLKQKVLQDTLKVLETSKIALNDSQQEDLARLIQELGGKVSEADIKMIREKFGRQENIYEANVEPNLKVETRLKIARHIFFQDRFEVSTFDFEVKPGWNILTMPMPFYKDSTKSKNDPDNCVTPCDEFYFNNVGITFDQDNLPGVNMVSKKLTLGELRNRYLELIKQCVYLENDCNYVVLFYWVLHTFMFKIFCHTPYLDIVGATSSGKSTLLKSIAFINKNSQLATVPTTATLFRLANSGKSLLWDESESLRNIDDNDVKAQLSILRAGFDVDTSNIPRCNDDNEVMLYSAYCPKVVCAETDLPDELESLKNRMFHIHMITAPRTMRDISLLKDRFEKLAQDFVDWVFDNFSIFYLLSIKFQDILEKVKDLHIAEIIKIYATNLGAFSEKFYKLKHRMQDISKPILTLACGNPEDLDLIHTFLKSQQEYIMNEIKTTSPEYNLLKCLFDIIQGEYDTGLTIYEKDSPDGKNLSFNDFAEYTSQNPKKIKVSHYYLKLILRQKYNIYKFYKEFMVSTFKVFDIKLNELRPQNRQWYEFDVESLKSAFKRKQISLGIDQTKADEKPITKTDIEFLKAIIAQNKALENTISDDAFVAQVKIVTDKLVQLLKNYPETTFAEVQSMLQLFTTKEVESLEVALKALASQNLVIKTPNGNIVYLPPGKA